MPTPSEQLLTRTVYATDGVTTNWDFSFSGGYLDKSHVKAFTEATTGERTEIIVTEAMLVGPFQVRIAPALATGLTLTVYRDTPKDLPLVDFTDESGFSEIALDTNAKQAVFIAAETTDTVNTSSSYDAEQAASLAAIAAAGAQVSANAAAASALLAANEADASAASAVVSASNATIFNDSTTAYTRTLLDDATAVAARGTLGAAASGANTDITSLGSIASINGGQLAGMRNLIMNGNMNVAQRGISFSPTVATEVYTLDRWISYSTGAAVSVQQSGGPNSGLPTALSAAGATSNTTTSFYQRVEAVNCKHLAGNSVTLSGWVYSTDAHTANWSVYSADVVNNFTAKTLRHNGSLVLSAGWNYVSANIPVFDTTAAVSGFQIGIGFGATLAGVVRAITGVQLEVGSVATPFEHRPIGMELALCQRYFCKTFPLATAPAQNVGNFAGCLGSVTPNANNSGPWCQWQFPVVMRTTPSVVTTFNPRAANANWRNVANTVDVASALATASIAESGVFISAGGVSTLTDTYYIHATASAEL